MWLDYGINHVALDPDTINDWIYYIPDKIRQLCISPYVENIEPKELFQYKRVYHIAGGVFTGSSENMLKYCELYKSKIEQIYNEGWYHLDEIIMSIIIKENSELFDLYYGDYEGIISNYQKPAHNINLIMKGIYKCIEYNNHDVGYHILKYVNNYFQRNYFSHLVYYHIGFHISIDYYCNNKKLCNNVIDLVKILKKIDKPKIEKLLEDNNYNINFYINKELLYD